MIETLLGGLLGGAFRLAPEILKWLDRKGERGHELSMQDKAIEFEKIRGAQRISEIGAVLMRPGMQVRLTLSRMPSQRKVGQRVCHGQMRCQAACGQSSPTG